MCPECVAQANTALTSGLQRAPSSLPSRIMQDDYRHGNYSGQPQLNSESDDLWRESVENATKLLDPDVYSDGNGCPQLLTHVRTIPSKSHSAEADTSGSQHEPHAVYADQIQPESQIVHYAPCPLHPSATHVDPYAARLSHWMPDPETTSQGAISLSYFPQQAWPLSPAYSAQNPNTSTMGHPPSPPPPPLTSCWTLHGRNDDNPHPMFGSFLIDGRERQSGVPKACDFWCVVSGSHRVF